MNRPRVIRGPVTGDDDAGVGGYELVECHMLAEVYDLLAARDGPARELAEINARIDAAVGSCAGLVADGMIPTRSGTCRAAPTGSPCAATRLRSVARGVARGRVLGELGSTAPDPAQADDVVSRPLVELMSRIEACGTREALAALRALAIVAASSVRAAACTAADRLAAGGLEDPTWVEGIGTPVMGACCGHLDPAGGRETVVATFANRAQAARAGGAHRPQPWGRLQGLLGERNAGAGPSRLPAGGR